MAADLNYDPHKSVSYYQSQVTEAEKQASTARLKGVGILVFGIALIIVNVIVSRWVISIWFWIIAIVVTIAGLGFIGFGPGMYSDEVSKTNANLARRRAEPDQQR